MYTLVTPSAVPLLDLVTVKQHVRVDDDDASFDAVLDIYMVAAAAAVEAFLGRALLTQTWQMSTGCFDGQKLDVDAGPNFVLTKVEVLVGGVYQDVTAQSVARSLNASHAIVRPALGQSWPAADRDEAAYRVTYTIGFGAAPTNVPGPILAGALLHVGDLFTNRESKTPVNPQTNVAIHALLGPYRAPAL